VRYKGVPQPPALLTVGHSTRPLAEFLALLAAHSVELVVDVRTIPRSRHNPQFEGEALRAALHQPGIGYLHLAGLGGLRHTRADSANTGWRNRSFRGYADYMQTPAFAHALDELLAAAHGHRAALMCAEAVPWRCHRSLIADALLVRGTPVSHILSAGKLSPHKMTPIARVDGWRVTYPGESL
jgi:uncharacterized protein (DUF488 family)